MSIKDVICDVILDAINSDNIRQLCFYTAPQDTHALTAS